MTTPEIVESILRQDYTGEQFSRIWQRVWNRMTRGDGYQPWGYDRPTLGITKPNWLRILDAFQFVDTNYYA